MPKLRWSLFSSAPIKLSLRAITGAIWLSLLISLQFGVRAQGQQPTVQEPTASPGGARNPGPRPSTAPAIVVVTGTFEPVPLAESNRIVVSFDAESQPRLYHSLVDFLELDPSIDLKQREVDGIQADLSIRGASFEQSLVLLNGLRINDAQTGHHDLDIPVPLDSLSRIEVLHGVGSTLYGSDAIGGAVNFLTGPPSSSEVRVRAGMGNFGFNQQAISGSFLAGSWSEELSASRDASSGFRPDRDYDSESLSSETRFGKAWGVTDLILAGSDRPFGADQFYGTYPSWERTKGWYASLSQGLGKDTDLAFGYRRHSDEFVLVRDDPSLYENNHVSQSWEGAVRRRSTVRENSTVAYGVEVDGEGIDSNNLGHHARNQEAAYLNFDWQFWGRVFLTTGAREEFFSGGRMEFSPTLAGGVWLGKDWRLRASSSRGFRLPTYTDLYYSDPANLGNPLLKPESAWDFEAGAEWKPGGRWSADLTAFHRRERNDIDYLKYTISAPWQASNIGKLEFTGVENVVRLRLSKTEEFDFSETWLHGTEPPSPGVISKYVFSYPSHRAVFAWLGSFKNAIALRSRVGITQRFERGAYPVWDFAATRTSGRIRPYLELSNLSNTGYEEIPGVSMPGRSIIAGAEILFRRSPKP
ncbi:MAG: TonB-dependent receptor plug domain-containing protein [Terriglobales bacterium]